MVASGLDITNFKEEPVESSYNSTSEQLKAKQVEAELYFKDKENKFNKVPLIQVYKYFMQLVNGSDVPFLKEQDVFSFIDKAFCLSDNIDKLEFTNTKDYKLIIWKLFHTFYEGCKENALYDKRKGTKKDYVELISNNFTNWEYSAIFENFGKAESKKWKKLQEFK